MLLPHLRPLLPIRSPAQALWTNLRERSHNVREPAGRPVIEERQYLAVPLGPTQPRAVQEVHITRDAQGLVCIAVLTEVWGSVQSEEVKLIAQRSSPLLQPTTPMTTTSISLTQAHTSWPSMTIRTSRFSSSQRVRLDDTTSGSASCRQGGTGKRLQDEGASGDCRLHGAQCSRIWCWVALVQTTLRFGPCFS
jgi:hypothetical protein